MKKHFSLIALFFFSAMLNAQNQYLPLLEDGKEWNYRIAYGNQIFTDSMSIIGDTLIDGQLYKKVINDWASMDSLLLLREDTTARQVYFLLDSTEYLLYDFSLELGDTVTIYTTLPGNGHLNFNPLQANVSLVDTFVDLNNIHRKRLWLNIPATPSFFIAGPWIEGIGGETGFVPISNNISINFTPNLLCAWNDGVQIYTNDSYDSCYYRLISVETFEKASYDIFPNPAIDDVVIRSKTHHIQSVKLYDLRGNVLLHHQNNYNEEEVTFNINGLASGMYVLRVESTSGGISTTKLQIQ